jgi:signal peptidase
VTRYAKPAVTMLCVAVSLLVVVVMLVPATLGLQRYVITGGSMTGTIDRGSVVYARLTPVGRLKVGDIVTFVPPGEQGPVTHRIISVGTGPNGERVFQTKGDFNTAADPQSITFSQPQQARYVYHVPYLGYLLAPLALRQLRLLLIGLPAVVIAISLLWSLWRSAGEEVRRQEAAPPVIRHTSGSADTE